MTEDRDQKQVLERAMRYLSDDNFVKLPSAASCYNSKFVSKMNDAKSSIEWFAAEEGSKDYDKFIAKELSMNVYDFPVGTVIKVEIPHDGGGSDEGGEDYDVE